MWYQVWSGSLPLGSVDLRDETLSAGWLQPTLAYQRVLGSLLQGACARIRAGGFQLAEDEAQRIGDALARVLASLVLKTPDGAPVPKASFDIWDDGPPAQGPFVVVTFGAEGTACGAHLPSQPPSPHLGYAG